MNKLLVGIVCLAALVHANPIDDDVIVEYLSNGEMRCRVNCHRNRQRNPNNPINPWNDCPPTNCPPPTRPANCGAPDCSNPANRVIGVHFDHPTDPNRFIVCAPLDAVTWAPKEQWCACGTVFSSVSNPDKCVHPWEWVQVCASQQNPPVLSTENCGEDCPDCDNGGQPVPPPIESPPIVPPPVIPPPVIPPPVIPPPVIPPPIESPPVFPPPDGNCPCPCICIWWPCQPCPNTCACNGRNQQPQQPSQPWFPRPPMRPNHPWDQTPVEPEWPSNPWDQATDDQWNQGPNNPWQQPRQPIVRPENPWGLNPDDSWIDQPRWPNNQWQQPRQPIVRPNNPWGLNPDDSWIDQSNWPSNPWQPPSQPWDHPRRMNGDEVEGEESDSLQEESV